MITERKVFDAAPETIPEMMNFIKPLTIDFSAKLSYNIKLVCEEILVNIVSYAYPDREGKLSILWTNDENSRTLKIEFEDWGIPFNPLEKPLPDLTVPIAEREIGGLGILMVRNLMDDVQYLNVDGKNILTVVKAY